jgi:hypothetical protein
MHSVVRLLVLFLLGASVALASPLDAADRLGPRLRKATYGNKVRRVLDLTSAPLGENAGRMARGLPPSRPRKLFSPSKTSGVFARLVHSEVLAHTDLAPFARRSSAPSTTFFVASGPASGSGSGSPTSKRDSVPGYFTVNQGVLQFSTDQDDAVALFWVDDFRTVLGWIATETVPALGIVEGTTYSLYAVPNG